MLRKIRDGIASNSPISKSKQNVVISSAEVPWNLPGVMLDRTHVHVKPLGERCDYKECVDVRKII